MRPLLIPCALILSVSLLAGCGGSNRQTAADDSRNTRQSTDDVRRAGENMGKAGQDIGDAGKAMGKSAQDMSKGAEEMAQGFAAMAKGLAAAAGNASAGGDVKPVDPVSFRELQTVMPDVPGWDKGSPAGERMTSPFSYSQASVTYKKGNARIEQKVMDSGFNQLLFAPFSMLMASGYEKETQDGYERSVSVEGNPGWEKWDKGSRNGELSVVVGKRFLVQVEGHGVDDIKDLQTVLDRTDLKKLDALK